MTTDVFNEHLGVIQALRDNYARNEDAAAVATLVKTQQELSAACSQREKHVKETIKREDGRSSAMRPRTEHSGALPAVVCVYVHRAACRPLAELTGRVHKIEKEAAYPAPEDAHEQQVAQLSAATQEAQENVASLNGQLQALQQQRQDVKAKVVKLQQTADHIEQIVTEAEPRTRCAMRNGRNPPVHTCTPSCGSGPP